MALAAAITRSGDAAAVQRLLALVTDEKRPAAERLAVLAGGRQGSAGVRSGGRPRGPAGRKSCRPQHSGSRGSVHSRTAGDAGRRAHRVGSPRLWPGAARDRREGGCEQVGLAEQASAGRHRSAPEPCAAASNLPPAPRFTRDSASDAIRRTGRERTRSARVSWIQPL